MRLRRLKNIHRSYKANYCSQEVLEHEIQSAQYRLDQSVSSIQNQRVTLRNFKIAQLLIRCENALFASQRYVNQHEYEHAIRSIYECKKWLAKLFQGIDVIKRYEEARKVEKALREDTYSVQLTRLPAFKQFTTHLGAAREAIEQQLFKKAEVIVQHVSSGIGQYREINSDTTTQSSLMREFRVLQQLYQDSYAWQIHISEPEIKLDIKVEQSFEALLSKGYSQFCSEILQDLTLILEERGFFMKVLSSLKPNQKRKEKPAIQSALETGKWHEANLYLLNRIISRTTKKIDKTKNKRHE